VRLQFGVDGVGLTASWEHVHNGDVLQFPPSAVIAADAALDGEVWCYGLELDLGQNIIDCDDPIPWVIDQLRRDPHSTPPGQLAADFVPGARELLEADARGNAYWIMLSVY
jgi:hypothetical protein